MPSGMWCGLVHRAASGLDMFLLEGLDHDGTQARPFKYSRLQSWRDSIPHDIDEQLAKMNARINTRNLDPNA